MSLLLQPAGLWVEPRGTPEPVQGKNTGLEPRGSQAPQNAASTGPLVSGSPDHSGDGHRLRMGSSFCQTQATLDGHGVSSLNTPQAPQRPCQAPAHRRVGCVHLQTVRPPPARPSSADHDPTLLDARAATLRTGTGCPVRAWALPLSSCWPSRKTDAGLTSPPGPSSPPAPLPALCSSLQPRSLLPSCLPQAVRGSGARPPAVPCSPSAARTPSPGTLAVPSARHTFPPPTPHLLKGHLMSASKSATSASLSPAPSLSLGSPLCHCHACTGLAV